MTRQPPVLPVTGCQDQAFLGDVLSGLTLPTKQIPPKYFYDAEGSQLFDRICQLPEYYLTRTELQIMQQYGAEIGAAIGAGALLVEPGSGSSVKVQLLLEHLQQPAGYVPVEICAEHLLESTARLAEAYPKLEILPISADFTQPFRLPTSRQPPQRRVVYFPGSTLGNFSPWEAQELLTTFREVAGPGGCLLLGVDLRKSPDVLIPAYDDAQGVTAAFNRNLLVRMNRELGADFVPEAFQHKAVWDERLGCIEMHLVSKHDQRVTLQGHGFDFRAGEPLITEHSHKYTLDGIRKMAARAGLRPNQYWSDEQDWFCVMLLEA